VIGVWLVTAQLVVAGALQGGRDGPARSARAAAPIDLTGMWVSVITTDWRYRMMGTPKGDLQGIPLTPAGRKAAEAWDPAKDAAAGEQCRAYGAPAIMQYPGRLRVSWADDDTLKIEIDTGEQTRLFHFAPRAPTARRWQGHSVAEWMRARGSAGALKVVTTNLRPGYLRNNGAPYGEAAVLTEYFDVVPGPDGDEWLIVTTAVEDPVNLQQPLIRSVQFKKQATSIGWDPTPCRR
jgi:hypothetical protein